MIQFVTNLISDIEKFVALIIIFHPKLFFGAKKRVTDV